MAAGFYIRCLTRAIAAKGLKGLLQTLSLLGDVLAAATGAVIARATSMRPRLASA